jgi:hypothetical protein
MAARESAASHRRTSGDRHEREQRIATDYGRTGVAAKSAR